MLRLDYMALTHPGRVPEKNEDNFYIDGNMKQNVDQECVQVSGNVKNGRMTAAVCDGMGGYASGEVSSLKAVQALQEFCVLHAGEEHPLRNDPMEYVTEANERICEDRRKTRKRMGSTLAVLEFSGDTVTSINLGDSRIYRMRNGILEQLSTDHTVIARMMRRGQITPEEAEKHPMRHQITQHLGIFPEEMLLEPASRTEMEVQEKDRYLICSDGLTDMIRDEEIGKILLQNEHIADAVRELVQSAVDAGGKDNITVVIIEAGTAAGLWDRLRGRITAKK